MRRGRGSAVLMLTLRLAEPWEARPLRCNARRGPRSILRCERSALHCLCGFHVARDRRGAWHFWEATDGKRT